RILLPCLPGAGVQHRTTRPCSGCPLCRFTATESNQFACPCLKSLNNWRQSFSRELCDGSVAQHNQRTSRLPCAQLELLEMGRGCGPEEINGDSRHDQALLL